MAHGHHQAVSACRVALGHGVSAQQVVLKVAHSQHDDSGFEFKYLIQYNPRQYSEGLGTGSGN